MTRYVYHFGEVDLSTGTIDTAKNNGQLAKIEGFIGANKQWSQRFGYDSLGRLAETREYRGDNNTLTYKQKFDFDRFGNLYRKTANNSTSGQSNPLTYTPIEDSDISKTTNRFTTNTTYDDAGRVTQDNKFREVGFSYDANGRQIKATKTSQPDANTVYDGLGNRVATKVNDVWRYMVYDAFGKLIAEYGTKTQDLGGVKYVQQDHQGSVRTTTNKNGYVVGRSDHQAFGDGIGSGVGLRTNQQGYGSDKLTTQGYGLTEDDEATGQQHTWFRKLETNAGRWTSPDPYKGSMSLGSSQSFNRYSYVESQPTNFVDPSGLLMTNVVWNCYWEYSSGVSIVGDDDEPVGPSRFLRCEVEIVNNGGEPPVIGGGGGGQTTTPLPTNIKERLITRMDANDKKCREFLDKVRKELKIKKTFEQLHDDVINEGNKFFLDQSMAGGKVGGLSHGGKTGSDVPLRPVIGASDEYYINAIIHELIHRAGVVDHVKYARAAFRAQSPEQRELNPWKKGGSDNDDSNYFTRMLNKYCSFEVGTK